MTMNTAHSVPVVSIIMPVRNEQEAIRRSVYAALSQDYPRDRLEVLIVDGMSDDDTRVIVSEISEHDPRVRLLENKARLMASGFNSAVSIARGEVILMLGGHTEISKTYISRCVRALQEKKAECVGGVVETVSDTRTGRAIALAMSSSFGVGGVNFRIGTREEKYVDTVAFGAYTRDIINRAGLLDETFVRNQDDEYNYRIRELGGRILLLPDVSCRYYSRSSFSALWQQYFRYGYWKVRVTQRHPRQMKPRHFVPMLLVTSLIFSLSLAFLSRTALALTALIVGSYFLSNLVASISIARKHNWRLLPLVPIAFATLHFAYGCGFLVGLLRFWKGWGKGRNPSATPLRKVEQI